MGDGETLELKKELRDAQEKLCEERHGGIEKRLDKIEKNQSQMFWWLLGIMSTAILNLGILLINVVLKN